MKFQWAVKLIKIMYKLHYVAIGKKINKYNVCDFSDNNYMCTIYNIPARYFWIDPYDTNTLIQILRYFK